MNQIRQLLLLSSLLVARTLPGQDYPIQPVPFTDVHFQSRFWSPRLETNRSVTIPFAFKKCEETGRIDNFAVAGGLKTGTFRGIRYDDSDVFKVIEGAAYSLAVRPDPVLDRYLDDLIVKIAAAQEPDGYLYTIRTIQQDSIKDPAAGKTRWSFEQDSHELYNVGHLYEAAVAHYVATGKKSLLNVATKNADLLITTFGEGKRYEVPGHEEIELGLVKLYRATKKADYLNLARFFIDQRGHHEHRKQFVAQWANPVDSAYYQDHLPVRQQAEPVGHVVRAGYLYAGMADVATLTNEPTYLTALNRIWDYTVQKKTYLTGGLGAATGTEGFGPAYDLPNLTAYNETCAAVASMLWNHRLFLLTGQSKYMDIFERTLYNGFLAGVSLSGDQFFYVNPLESDGKRKFNVGQAPTRSPWFGTSCCPTNVARFLPSLPGYVYAVRDDQLLVNLFVAGTGTVRVGSQAVRVTQQTDYPWDGRVTFVLQPDQPTSFALNLRLPGWAMNEVAPGALYQYADADRPAVTIQLNGKPVTYTTTNGYAVLRRTWKPGDRIVMNLTMPIRQVTADDRLTDDRGKVALERGPLVYCVEGVDNGGSVGKIAVSKSTRYRSSPQPALLNGVVTIQATGSNAASPPAFTAIPYYAWCHRGAGEMAVWLPRGN